MNSKNNKSYNSDLVYDYYELEKKYKGALKEIEFYKDQISKLNDKLIKSTMENCKLEDKITELNVKYNSMLNINYIFEHGMTIHCN